MRLGCRFSVFQEAQMALKNVLAAIVCMTLLAWNCPSVAEGYRAGEFLGLDLSSAVLSPKPLGPAASFVPGPLDVTINRGGEGVQARAEPKADPAIRAPVARVVPAARVATIRAEKPRAAVRTRLARRHGNPLDAQALDTRIQVWPCKSGGICDWKR
jgi:hypothetical protein